MGGGRNRAKRRGQFVDSHRRPCLSKRLFSDFTSGECPELTYLLSKMNHRGLAAKGARERVAGGQN